MDFGVPAEVRPQEFRGGLSPGAVDSLTKAGHRVYVESSAGRDAGFSDEAYRQVGAQIVYTAGEAWRRAQVMVKVARPTKCVPNVPALVARTSSYALSNAVLPHLLTLGRLGIPAGFESDPALGRGVITQKGRLVHTAVAAALAREPEVSV